MLEIEIDGKKIETEPGSMIIQAADASGVYIPRFCYHKKLSIAANCRMCLVEVEKIGKPVPACATPVSQGMKIFTKSEKALAAQRAVMEFLLINHPLDCPICDQGGECELQDLALGYGDDISRYAERKRAVDDENLGSLIATDMTRCIHCTRCVRFGAEVAGMRELGTVWRGEHMEIKTYVDKSLVSEVSGNIIDLCPVGALTSKPYRFTARAWELQQRPAIAPHDCLGSNLNVHVRRQEVMRVVPRTNEAINETWLSDRDRFSYTGLNSDDRLLQPMVKRDERWHEVSWEDALTYVKANLQKSIAAHGPEQLAGLISPNATVEEHYLFQKIIRDLGSSNIEHRIRQTDFADQASMPLYPGFNDKIADLENKKVILIINTNIRHELPLAAIRLRKASLAGAQIFSISSIDYGHNFTVNAKVICHPTDLVQQLAGLVKAVSLQQDKVLPSDIAEQLKHIEPTAEQQLIAQALLQENQSGAILIGAQAQQHPQASAIRLLAKLLAEFTGASNNLLTEGANTAGAWVAGAIPHRGALGITQSQPGQTYNELLTDPKKAYLIYNIEPEQDCANPAQISTVLQQAELVVAFTAHNTAYLQQHANVMLPTALFTETSGTYVNAEGLWQSFAAVTPAPEQVKPGWKVLRVLGNLLELTNFNYDNSIEIRDELQNMLANHHAVIEKPASVSIELSPERSKITRITEWPMYRVDNIVRRAMPLQQAASHELLGVRMNSQMAKQLDLAEGTVVNIQQNSGQARLSVIVDERVPNECVYIANGFAETSHLAESFGAVTIHV